MKRKKPMKVNLCAIMKNEAPYVKEWVDWHKKFRFDNIVVYDNGGNGDLSGLGITVIPFENVPQPQLRAYQDWINRAEFDSWTLFIDADEFYEGEKPHELLKPYTHCDTVRLNWKCFGSLGQIKYEDSPVQNRFNIPLPKDCVYNESLPEGVTENCHIKNFYHKTFKTAQAQIHNTLVKGGLCVNASGVHENGLSPWQEVCWDFAFIKHYITKSAEEFAKRRFNTKDACGNVVATNDKLIERYFRLNGYDKETEDFFNAYLNRNSENIQPVSSECDNAGVSDGTQPGDTDTNSGTVKQVNGTVHSRVKRGTK